MWIIVPIALVAVAVWGLLARARLLRLRRHAELYWDEMSAHLESRWQLIPQLLNAIRTVMPERDALLDHVEAARGRAMEAEALPEHALCERELNDAMFRVLALFLERTAFQEDAAIRSMEVRLAEADDAIQMARTKYNDIVFELNRTVTTFPRSLVASLSGVKACDYYACPGEEPDRIEKGLI